MQEKQILIEIDHPFIIEHERTFKDEKRLYFLTEFVLGCDFIEIQKQAGLFNSNDARFYTACLLLILEYLHEKDIIYRDLRPENIFVDQQGFIKLANFDCAKILSEGRRTYTLVGTPQYMAPEVISGKGYSIQADIWSLGVILYEMICAELPFGENLEDPNAVYQEILTKDLEFPSFISSDHPAVPVIIYMLDKENYCKSLSEIKADKWLEPIEWDQLTQKQINPPYKADIKATLNDLQNLSKGRVDLLE